MIYQSQYIANLLQGQLGWAYISTAEEAAVMLHNEQAEMTNKSNKITCADSVLGRNLQTPGAQSLL